MNIQDLMNFLQYSYIRAIITFVVFFFFSKVFVIISEKGLLKLARKTKTKIDEYIIERTNKPISLILILIGLRLAIIPLGLAENVTHVASLTVSSFIVLLVTYMVIVITNILLDGWAKKWIERGKRGLDQQLLTLLHRFSKILFSILGFLFILDLWGIQIGALLASLGIAGIAVAFALQNTLGNIFGGISMIIDKTIKVGDVIALDPETRGTVMDIGLRSTKIRTFNNQIITIPNGKLAANKIENYVQPDPSARVLIQFGVAYGSNIDKVKKIVMKVIKNIDDLKKDKEPFVRFIEMGDSALIFKVYFWVNSYKNRIPATDEANEGIYNALNKAKISIPYPQMDVHIKKK